MMPVLLAFGLALVFYSIMDMECRRIPHKYTAPAILMGIIYQLGQYVQTGNPYSLTLAMVVGGGFFLAADFITRHGWWGGADTLLLTATGFFVGGSLEMLGKFLFVFPLAYLGVGHFYKMLSPEKFLPLVPVITFAFLVAL